jgi:putative two-component system response regulator
MIDPQSMVHHLAQMGMALTSVRDIDDLLEMIVERACTFAGCDGGTVYTREHDALRFVVWRNETLRERDGVGGGIVHEGNVIPITQTSIAGYVASTGDIVNLADAYEIPAEAPFSFNRDIDIKNGYRTKSVLCVPMSDANGQVVGVLQLINALGPEREVISFPAESEPLVRSLASQAAVALQNAQLNQRLRDSYVDTIFRLSVAAEYRDTDTHRHIQRISWYSWVIATQLGLGRKQAELIRVSAPMHDIGKIGVPDAVLLKPGPLTDDERKVMQEHTIIGGRILEDSDSEIIQESSVVATTHHERWDGGNRGYPNGLKGEDIPLAGRVVALADAFDCISSKRVYKTATSFERAVDIVQKDSGSHFCPACVEAFTKGLDEIYRFYEELQESPQR